MVEDKEKEEAVNWARQPKSQGMNQLDQINAMERQQDNNLWASNALFAAIQGILLVALFSGPRSIFSLVFLGIVGLIVSAAWAVIVVRARTYEKYWIEKAKALQKDLQLPSRYAIWEDRSPSGIPAWTANVLLLATFVVMWAFVIGVAAGIGGISFP